MEPEKRPREEVVGTPDAKKQNTEQKDHIVLSLDIAKYMKRIISICAEISQMMRIDLFPERIRFYAIDGTRTNCLVASISAKDCSTLTVSETMSKMLDAKLLLKQIGAVVGISPKTISINFAADEIEFNAVGEIQSMRTTTTEVDEEIDFILDEDQKRDELCEVTIPCNLLMGSISSVSNSDSSDFSIKFHHPNLIIFSSRATGSTHSRLSNLEMTPNVDHCATFESVRFAPIKKIGGDITMILYDEALYIKSGYKNSNISMYIARNVD